MPAAQPGIGQHPLHGRGEDVGSFVSSTKAASPAVSGTAAAPNATTDVARHRLDDRDTEAFVFAARDEHVGRVVVRGEGSELTAPGSSTASATPSASL